MSGSFHSTMAARAAVMLAPDIASLITHTSLAAQVGSSADVLYLVAAAAHTHTLTEGSQKSLKMFFRLSGWDLSLCSARAWVQPLGFGGMWAGSCPPTPPAGRACGPAQTLPQHGSSSPCVLVMPLPVRVNRTLHPLHE